MSRKYIVNQNNMSLELILDALMDVNREIEQLEELIDSGEISGEVFNDTLDVMRGKFLSIHDDLDIVVNELNNKWSDDLKGKLLKGVDKQ